jgi:hypothetical protein
MKTIMSLQWNTRHLNAVAHGLRRLSTRPSRKSSPRGYKGSKENLSELPQFSDLLRQFYRQSHPDLLRATHAEHATVNDDSWQVLNGILSTIKERDSYPPQMNKAVPFFLRTKDAETGIKRVELKIRTAGGCCKKQLATTMENFFVESGIAADGKFIWGKEYFPTAIAGEKLEEEEQ